MAEVDRSGTKLYVRDSSIPGGTRLTVIGELDLVTAPDLGADVHDALIHGDVVEIDLSQVTFMDSSGLRALIEARTSASAAQRITVVDASSQVMRLMDVTGLGELFGLPQAS